ncbi:hypothetical protein Y032_0108g78 [Ancylostoma ceylanicum]|uniref:Carboxylesterase type B domain-containing protein n=1 Tax=Ancylostoma ceylanicum TaxID=53326 RepID=A0A016TEI5_9BILA|nr:hypothetical protein Y032_0108g78 [Ancylostoma ceylanicum]
MDDENYPDSRIVMTKYGSVLGRRLIHEGERQVDAFQGIPFAEPPVGRLRFRKPLPLEPWEGVKVTKSFSPVAIQLGQVGPTSEDILYLNVFTPVWKASSASGFAVLVFIHGGGYAIGSARKFGDIGICRNLCTKDVVVVTMQYRIGYLGFFSTGDEECPGNLALWDQLLALKWVKENISQFDGDPENITLMGHSSGACCVDLLSLSPYSRDLFSRMILMSGNAECAWALRHDMVEVSRSFTRKLGLSGDLSSREVMEKLRDVPSDQFALGTPNRNNPTCTVRREVGPCYDNDFLPEVRH